MRQDLKILFWLFLITLMVLAVYTLVDYTFDALDNPKTVNYFRSFKPSYTDKPSDVDPDVQPDLKWKPPRSALPIVGYVHESVIIMVTGIIIVAALGFWIVYLVHRKD